MNLSIKEIMKRIPHRYPFLLVDKVLELEAGKSIIGLKNVTFNEHFFIGHFPEEPVMPGVLIIEAMAQVAAILISYTMNADTENNIIYFLSIEEAKFRKAVVPGDTLILKCNLVQSRSNVWKFAAKAYVDDVVVAESQFAAMLKDK